MNDDLRTIPPEWDASSTARESASRASSAYAIESILPADDRRFLQLREPFMVLVGNSPVRAGILECAHFELARKLRSDEAGQKRDLEWREDQYALLTGADPRGCDLWAPFQNELIVSRLCGMATEQSTIAGALKWLEDAGFIFRKRMGRNRNDRMILLNIKQIQRDQRDHPKFSGHRFKPAVSGSPDQLIEEPMETIFTPLYEGLVTVVAKASSKEGLATCRAALLLHRILRRAELRDQAGEAVAAPWSVRDVQSTFGWGSKDSWLAAMNQLIHSGLILEKESVRRTLSLEPNLPKILTMVDGPVQSVSPLIVQNEDSDTPQQGQTYSTTGTVILQSRDGHSPEQGQGSVLKGSEFFSESLTEYLAELNAAGDFNPSKILEDHSDHIFEVRRKTQFVGLPFENGWESLTFGRLAQTDEELAAAALQLAQELGRGERSAIAFPRATRKAKAIIAVILGYWIDDHVTGTAPAEWITIDGTWFEMYNADFKKPEEQPLANARRDMDRRLEATNNALIIENIAGSRQHAQIITKLKSAITGRADNLMPVIYVGLPDSVSDLSPKLDDGGLTPIVVRSLTERHERFEVPDPPASVRIAGETLEDDPFGEP